VPWKTAYRSKDLIGGNARFVLAASGHIAGVINPPSRNKRSHWLNDELASDPQSWFENAQENPGSWWPDWDAWVKSHSNGTVRASTQQANARYHPMEPAPGRYVKEKSN
jgi:polyhydroxyalkanoate synthase